MVLNRRAVCEILLHFGITSLAAMWKSALRGRGEGGMHRHEKPARDDEGLNQEEGLPTPMAPQGDACVDLGNRAVRVTVG